MLPEVDFLALVIVPEAEAELVALLLVAASDNQHRRASDNQLPLASVNQHRRASDNQLPLASDNQPAPASDNQHLRASDNQLPRASDNQHRRASDNQHLRASVNQPAQASARVWLRRRLAQAEPTAAATANAVAVVAVLPMLLEPWPSIASRTAFRKQRRHHSVAASRVAAAVALLHPKWVHKCRFGRPHAHKTMPSAHAVLAAVAAVAVVSAVACSLEHSPTRPGPVAADTHEPIFGSHKAIVYNDQPPSAIRRRNKKKRKRKRRRRFRMTLTRTTMTMMNATRVRPTRTTRKMRTKRLSIANERDRYHNKRAAVAAAAAYSHTLPNAKRRRPMTMTTMTTTRRQTPLRAASQLAAKYVATSVACAVVRLHLTLLCLSSQPQQQPAAPNTNNRTLWVKLGSAPFSTVPSVRKFFSKAGAIESIEAQGNKRHVFVTFETRAQAEAALKLNLPQHLRKSVSWAIQPRTSTPAVAVSTPQKPQQQQQQQPQRLQARADRKSTRLNSSH
mgnify:CR=1 FL=1